MRDKYADRGATAGIILTVFVLHAAFGRDTTTVLIGIAGAALTLPWVDHYRVRASEA